MTREKYYKLRHLYRLIAKIEGDQYYALRKLKLNELPKALEQAIVGGKAGYFWETTADRLRWKRQALKFNAEAIIKAYGPKMTEALLQENPVFKKLLRQNDATLNILPTPSTL